MAEGKGRVQRARHSSTGNGALLAIVNGNGGYWDQMIVDETILVALEHFGMPYRVLDLACERLTMAAARHCAAILLAQDHVAASLTKAEASVIAEAVKAGTGLVNFDGDLRHVHSPLHEIFGFSRVNPHAIATDLVRIPESRHYVTRWQNPGEYHKFDRMVTATIAEEWGTNVTPLAEAILGKEQLVYIRHLSPWSAYEPRNHPVLFATRWGRGKAVQFTLNPRVWRKAFMGHARDMDDLFWQSILWVARKPFAANMIPPFVTLSVDDCVGTHDFQFADTASQCKFVPIISLFLKSVPERLFSKIRAGLESGKIQYDTHALDYNTLLTFNFGKGECTRAELDERFAYNDWFWNNVGAKPGATLRLHWGEYGVNGLPYCKARGHIFFCPALQTGLHKADMCMGDGFWPYDLQTCYYDYLPDDHDFFAFGAFAARQQEDFLTGCTPNLRETEHTDVEKAARSAARQIAHGLRGAFYAEVVTHEQKISVMSREEWERILTGADKLTSAYDKIFTSHDHVGHYLKGKGGVWIEDSTVDGNHVHCRLAGCTAAPLQFSIFDDEDDSARREYRTVNPFSGNAELG